jgi:hypothetical protein
MIFKTLVFGGGGTRCLVYLPALAKLQIEGKLNNIENVWGTSAGALVASLFLLSKKADKVKDIVFNVDFKQSRNIDITNMLNIQNTWGIDDGDGLRNLIINLFEQAQKGSSTYRLLDIIGIHIVITDLTLRETLILDSNTFPDLLLVDAVRASMCLPFFYRPFSAPNGHIWIDGGLRENFPWNMVPPNQRKEALGFALFKNESNHPKSLSQYILSIIHFNEPLQCLELQKEYKNIIWFDTPPYPAWFTNLQKEDYELLETRSLEALNIFNSYSKHPLRNVENQQLFVDQNIPLQVYLEGRTVELSGSQKLSHEQVQDSFPPQLPYKQQSYRRWSL